MGHCRYELQGHLCKNLFLADPGSDYCLLGSIKFDTPFP